MLPMGNFVKNTLFFIAAAFLLSGCDNSPEAKEKSQKRDAIKVCWSDHDKKSLDDDAKRFIAGVCEKMETDFKTKYGVSP